MIAQAIVREAEGDQYADHPVHLGGEAFVLAELKVTPVVEKKQPGRWVGAPGLQLVRLLVGGTARPGALLAADVKEYGGWYVGMPPFEQPASLMC